MISCSYSSDCAITLAIAAMYSNLDPTLSAGLPGTLAGSGTPDKSRLCPHPRSEVLGSLEPRVTSTQGGDGGRWVHTQL